MAKRIIRLPIVEERTGLSRSSIYAGIAAGTFPSQIPLSGPAGRAVGFDSDAVDRWIENRIAEAEAHASMHVNKAAIELRMLPEELRPFIESGELPTFKVGKHELVRKTALNAFQRRREQQHAGALSSVPETTTQQA